VKALMTSRQAKSIARKIVDELESNFVPPYDAEEMERSATSPTALYASTGST
jgi:hypothetical protein